MLMVPECQTPKALKRNCKTTNQSCLHFQLPEWIQFHSSLLDIFHTSGLFKPLGPSLSFGLCLPVWLNNCIFIFTSTKHILFIICLLAMALNCWWVFLQLLKNEFLSAKQCVKQPQYWTCPTTFNLTFDSLWTKI